MQRAEPLVVEDVRVRVVTLDDPAPEPGAEERRMRRPPRTPVAGRRAAPARPFRLLVNCEAMSESVSSSDRTIDSTSFGSTMAAMTTSGIAAASRMPPRRGRRMRVQQEHDAERHRRRSARSSSAARAGGSRSATVVHDATVDRITRPRAEAHQVDRQRDDHAEQHGEGDRMLRRARRSGRRRTGPPPRRPGEDERQEVAQQQEDVASV